ncbi:MAG TPA: autotransporter-associated beta strand repeat-containing protein [Candidatus Paceibacterota bacterium]|nr:autotransporter-associated beta strand repeat-containing protein [Verrucomicrobiota bacterium]HSA10149.1 autotransporter-associated beta strand repeat-containing protein [Candidatus Paceibacterota bacterium]
MFWVGAGIVIDWGKDAINDTTIYGNGSLSVVNPGGDFIVRQTSANSGTHRATLDMSGLDTFNASVNRVSIGDTTGSGKNTRPVATVMLAKTNFISCFRGATATDLIIGQGQSQAGNGTLYLGQTNAIFSDAGLTVGRQKCTAWLGFNTNIVMENPVALFRDNAGTGRQAQWLIGEHATGSTTTGNRGTVDFSYGTVDALVDVMYVGRGQTEGGSAAGRGTLSFTNGLIDVNTLYVGFQRSAFAPGQGTVNVDNGAQLTVNGDLTLGLTIDAGAPSTGVLNIGQTVPGGSVWVKGNVVEGGGTGDYIWLTGGSLKVGGTLGQADKPLQNMAINNASITFDRGGAANPTAPLWHVANFSVTGTVTNNVEGAGLTLGQFPLISCPFGIFGDGFNALQLGSLPGRLGGYLSNNIASSTVDLVITTDSSPKWNGNVAGGDWDINATANWVPVTGGAPITYSEPEVPGDKALFDDSATGTTTVNLTTTLSPSSVTVNNPSKNYTFTGSGRLSGPGALNKIGAAMLTISNTGTNDFTGPVAINGGKVLLSGSADRLPTTAAVTLADVGGAALDLNGQNQMIGSLSGGGASGGSVSLGTGTLDISGNGGVYGGVISGDGAVVKSGSGTQKFTAANTYAGGTIVSGGMLVLANPDGSGVGPGSVVVGTNGSLRIGDGGANGSIAASTIVNDGLVGLDRSDDLTWTTLMTGSGGFAKYNVNKLTASTPNNYSGPTYINGGILHLTDSGALGTTGVVAIANGATTALELPGGITLSKPLSVSQKPSAAGEVPAIINLDGTNILAGPITGVGGGTYWTFQSDAGVLVVTGSFTADAGSGQTILRVIGNGDCDWQGDIITPAGYPGTTWLLKSGAGTWTLSGNNSLSGKVNINNGRLVVNGILSGSTGISVNAGTLAGSGLVDAPVNVGGTLSPAGDSIGTLTINNSLTLSNNAVAAVQVSQSAHDRVTGLSSVALGGTLRVTVTNTLVGGEAFRLFEAASYSGDFASYELPALNSPLSWDTTSVPVDGTLRVAGSNRPQIATATILPDNNFQLSGTGPADQTYWILATSDVAEPLSNWMPLTTNTFTGGVFNWTDLEATNHPRRFYQVVIPAP